MMHCKKTVAVRAKWARLVGRRVRVTVGKAGHFLGRTGKVLGLRGDCGPENPYVLVQINALADGTPMKNSVNWHFPAKILELVSE